MNRLLKKLVLTLVAGAFLATPTLASAQSPSEPASPVALARVPTFVPAPAPAPRIGPASAYDWKGFYVGGTLGYGGSLSDTKFDFLPNVQDFGALPTTLNPEPMGWTYGFHGGWNMASGMWIFGIEADYFWSTIDGNVQLNPVLLDDGSDFNGTYTVQQDLEWLSTVRGRFGTKVSKYFVYGTGGIGWGGINSFAEADYNPEGTIRYPATDDGTRTGWTIGGGIEGALTDRLSWRAQYLYIDFGTTNAVGDPVPAHPPFQVTYEFKNITNSFTFGVNYRF